MRSLSLAGGPVQPEALGALQSWLWDNHYSVHAVDAIVAWTAEEGTPTGSPYLDRQDEAMASEAYVEAMGRVSHCSNTWDDPGIWMDLDSLLEGGPRTLGVPIESLVPPELDPEPYVPSEEDELYLSALAAADAELGLGLPPIAGGSAEAERLDRLEELLDDPGYGLL